MNPLTGSPFAFWMTGMMWWAEVLTKGLEKR
jgi:hypothetical protein